LTLHKDLETTLGVAFEEAHNRHHEFVTLEHLLFAFCRDRAASLMLKACGADPVALQRELEAYFDQRLGGPPEGRSADSEPEQTPAFRRVLQRAAAHVQSSGRDTLEAGDVLVALFREPSSHALYLLQKQGVSRLDVLQFVAHGVSKDDSEGEAGEEAPGGEGLEGEDEPAPAAKDPLAAYTTNLLERAQQGKLDPLIGRTAEVARSLQILSRRRRNNPVYVGEPGVGKTAIVEGLALAIHEKRVPDLLLEAEIFSLDMGALLAGTKFRGQFEERLKGVIQAIKKRPHAILFIDEIHTLVGAGATSGGSMDASNLLKPALASGEIRCIGATTFKEYKASFERDRALERRFQKIEVQEPSIEETVLILQGLRSRYEEHHHVQYSPEGVRAAAELAAKYINDRHLPDKAIDVLDEAGAVQRLLPAAERVAAIGPQEMEQVVSKMAKVPARSVSTNDEQALALLEPELKKVIFGQDAAVASLVSAIKLSRSGLGPQEKPIGSFLFSGPTCVGKTELAKQLARVLGVEFLRFDMSEYMEKHTISRLIGAPPGYVGFDQGGLLTDAVRKSPYAVLVLDEIEKAHPDLFNILLQVMDHASLTDNYGRKADFRHVVLILTTNAGAREMTATTLGFGSSGSFGSGSKESGSRGKAALERTFSPEFRNRLDASIVFDSLTPEVICKVVDKQVGELAAQLAEKKVSLELTPEARNWLSEHGFDPQFGARPMARLIRSELAKPLAEAILFGLLKGGGSAKVGVEGDKLGLTLQGLEVPS